MISVILPVYNGEKYIKEAIDSVLTQTLDTFELIIVNDGSTDSTEEIIFSYEDSRIKYFHQENRGRSASRNLGIKNSSYDFIAFIDADDVYDPNKLYRQHSILCEYPDVDVVYTALNIVDESMNKVSELRAEIIFEHKEDLLATLFFRQPMPSPIAIMLRKKCCTSGIMFNEYFPQAEDYDFLIQLSMHFKFFYLDELLYNYRKHSSNVTNNLQDQIHYQIEIIKQFSPEEIKGFVDKSFYSSEEKKLILAKIFYKIDDLNESCKYFNEIKSPDFQGIKYFYLGNLSYKAKDYCNARKFYYQSIENNPDRAEVYNNLACVFAKESESYFEKALNVKERYNDAHKNLTLIKTEWNLTDFELRKDLMLYVQP